MSIVRGVSIETRLSLRGMHSFHSHRFRQRRWPGNGLRLLGLSLFADFGGQSPDHFHQFRTISGRQRPGFGEHGRPVYICVRRNGEEKSRMVLGLQVLKDTSRCLHKESR